VVVVFILVVVLSVEASSVGVVVEAVEVMAVVSVPVVIVLKMSVCAGVVIVEQREGAREQQGGT